MSEFLIARARWLKPYGGFIAKTQAYAPSISGYQNFGGIGVGVIGNACYASITAYYSAIFNDAYYIKIYGYLCGSSEQILLAELYVDDNDSELKFLNGPASSPHTGMTFRGFAIRVNNWGGDEVISLSHVDIGGYTAAGATKPGARAEPGIVGRHARICTNPTTMDVDAGNTNSPLEGLGGFPAEPTWSIGALIYKHQAILMWG